MISFFNAVSERKTIGSGEFSEGTTRGGNVSGQIFE